VRRPPRAVLAATRPARFHRVDGRSPFPNARELDSPRLGFDAIGVQTLLHPVYQMNPASPQFEKYPPS
jgi:hypothetical protein